MAKAARVSEVVPRGPPGRARTSCRPAPVCDERSSVDAVEGDVRPPAHRRRPKCEPPTACWITRRRPSRLRISMCAWRRWKQRPAADSSGEEDHRKAAPRIGGSLLSPRTDSRGSICESWCKGSTANLVWRTRHATGRSGRTAPCWRWCGWIKATRRQPAHPGRTGQMD